jgi:hypothetical protein
MSISGCPTGIFIGLEITMKSSIKNTALFAACMLVLAQAVVSEDVPQQLAAPNAKPVKVYILSGQSNMVGIGQVRSGTTRWTGITDATVSVYKGAYSADADYDKLEPLTSKDLPVYGGTEPTSFPGGGVQVSRGFMAIKDSGVYRFNPGYGQSTHCIMEMGEKEVYRKEVGEKPLHADFKVAAGKKYPFKITFLTNAADGLGWSWRTDVAGTLDTLVQQGKFPHLVDSTGHYISRKDVWYKGLVTAGANKPLSIGCGATSSSIGPELQFGHLIGDYHDEPVIIIKSSQGNRSLSWDFLPPGSKPFTFEGVTYAGYKGTIPSWTKDDPGKAVNWYAGKQYDDCFNAIHDVLNNFGTHFPQYKDQGYEIAGFVWWQGHKDGGAAPASRYEHNLVQLIQSLRKEFQAANAPFVIGTIGFGGWKLAGDHLKVANAQLAVSGATDKYPQFKGNVLTVETRDFWQEAAVSPRDQDFHYNGNAGTYMMVGDALGRGMIKLLNETSKSR